MGSGARWPQEQPFVSCPAWLPVVAPVLTAAHIARVMYHLGSLSAAATAYPTSTLFPNSGAKAKEALKLMFINQGGSGDIGTVGHASPSESRLSVLT